MRHSDKIILTTIACFAVFGLAQATTITTTPTLQDASGTKVQGHADNGKKEQALTVAKTTAINMSNDVSWRAYVPSDCKFMSFSTATITSGAMRKTLLGGQYIIQPVNKKTPFLVYSGCTSGELSRM